MNTTESISGGMGSLIPDYFNIGNEFHSFDEVTPDEPVEEIVVKTPFLDVAKRIMSGVSPKSVFKGALLAAGLKVGADASRVIGDATLNAFVEWLKRSAISVGVTPPSEMLFDFFPKDCEVVWPKVPKEYYSQYFMQSTPMETVMSPRDTNSDHFRHMFNSCTAIAKILKYKGEYILYVPSPTSVSNKSEIKGLVEKAQFVRSLLEDYGITNGTLAPYVLNKVSTAKHSYPYFVCRRQAAPVMEELLDEINKTQARRRIGDVLTICPSHHNGSIRCVAHSHQITPLDKLPINSVTRSQLQEQIDYVTRRVASGTMTKPRTIVLQGLPGTCKTSICTALPKACNTVGWWFDEDKNAVNILSTVPGGVLRSYPGNVVIIDEADGFDAFRTNKLRPRHNAIALPMSKSEQRRVTDSDGDSMVMPEVDNGSIDKRDLHNYLTGPMAPPYFNVITTNYPERLSSAILRVGRVDKFITALPVDDAGIKHFLKANFDYDTPEGVTFPDRKANHIYQIVDLIELDGVDAIVDRLVNNPVVMDERTEAQKKHDEEETALLQD